ncbi:MAG: autotransporter assembly complex protein TamA [Gammaproteobacteria bacterium]|jgi:translocation and assembly module TamA
MNLRPVFNRSLKRALIPIVLCLGISTHAEEKEELIRTTVSGASDEVKENILALKPSFTPACTASRDEAEKFQAAANPKIESALRALGYYSAGFSTDLRRTENCWELAVQVTQGKPVVVRKQEISVNGEGREEPGFRKLLASPPYTPGEPLRHDKYASYKSELENYASSMGYLDSFFTRHEIVVDPASGVADIHLVMETGSRYRFGKVSVEQSVLNSDYIQKYILIKEGDAFSTDALVEQQQLIQSAGYYGNVRVRARYKLAKNLHVPVEITAEPAKKSLYRGRIGYGTDTGFRAGVDYERRWLDSKGSRITSTLNISQIEILGNISYIVPAKKRLDEYMRYFFNISNEYGDDIDSESFELGAAYHRLNSSGWDQIVSLRYLNDRTKASGEPLLETQFLIAGVRVQKSVADNPIFTRKGWLLRAGLEGAYEGFISSSDFLQATMYAKLIQPAGEKGRLIVRSELGSTMIDDVNLLPKSLRFFAGGDNSVRGYGYESLGPKNNAGTVIGGRHLFIASLEYEYMIKDPWGAALFVDTGNAFNDWQNMDLQTGVGFGARWRSPIGPVRVDVAWPTDDFSDPHLHLSIGPDF